MIIAILKSYLLNHKGLWCMYWAVQLIRMRISKLEEKKNTHTDKITITKTVLYKVSNRKRDVYDMSNFYCIYNHRTEYLLA